VTAQASGERLSAAPFGARRAGLALRLALRDMRGGFAGFKVFLACLAVGVAAVMAVLSISRALEEGIAAEGRFILGGDISFSLIHRQADAKERDYMAALGTVSEIAGVRSMARAATGRPPALVELKAVDGRYPLYGAVALSPELPLAEALEQRDGTWGLAVDDALLARLDVAVGEEIAIGQATFQVRAAIAGEPDRAADGLAFGPRVLMSADAFAASGLIQPGSLIRWTYRVALGDAAQAAPLRRTVGQAEKHFAGTGWRIASRARAAPGVAGFADRLTLFLSLVGLTALVVGGVGVANAAAAHLDQKRAVIATLKCLGAPGALVFRIYLIEIMALAGLGVAIGLTVGALLPFALEGALGAAIELPLRVDLYLKPLAFAAACGLLTALVFSLWPLGRARDIAPAALFRDLVAPSGAWPRRDVLAAMAVAGGALAVLVVLGAEDRWIAAIYVAGSIVSFAVLTALGRGLMWVMRRLPRPRSPELRLGLASLYRPGAATPGVVLSLGLGLTLLVMVGLIDANIERELTSELPQNAPSFFVLDIPKDRRADFVAITERAAGVSEVEIVPMLRGHVTALKGRPSSEVDPESEGAWVLRGDRGVTYAGAMPKGSKLVTGEWWPEDYQGPQLVSFVHDLAEDLGLKLGDSITVNVLGRDLTAEIASTRKVDWRGLGINFVLIFSPGAIEQAPHAWLATVAMDREGEGAFVREVTTALPSATPIGVRDALGAVADLLESITLAIRAAGAVAIVSGALVLGGAVAAGRRRRIYDAVVLKAFGATRGSILAAYLIEFAVLGLVTAIFAVAAGSLAAFFVLTEAMDTDFVLIWPVAAGILALGVGATVVIGFLGTWTALGAKAAPILRSP
jgi:putative ABC transport system permease protein